MSRASTARAIRRCARELEAALGPFPRHPAVAIASAARTAIMHALLELPAGMTIAEAHDALNEVPWDEVNRPSAGA